MPKELTHEEIRNNILAEIHNRLAEISTYLKTGLAIFAKLNSDDLDTLEEQNKLIRTDTNEGVYSNYVLITPNSEKNSDGIGYSKEKGLYLSCKYKHDNGKWSRDDYPLGDFERTAPIDKNTGAFLEQK